MDYLKANYDRVLLLLAALALLGAAAHSLLGLGAVKEQFVTTPPPTEGAAFTPNENLSKIRSQVPKLLEPAQFTWQEPDSSLFVSRVYLLRDNQLVDIFESDIELFPGLPNEWVLDNNLDYTDTGLAERDTDGDGFTNLEEFAEKTNPRDSNSKPGAWKKLRMVGSKIDKLRTKIASLPTGGLEQVAINTISAENPRALVGATKIYKKGDTIKLTEIGADGRPKEVDSGLKFVDARMIKQHNPRLKTDQDVPQITLLNTADGRTIDLLIGEVKDSPYSVATLQDIRPNGQTYELRTGESFTLDGSLTYKLIDVTPENAIIEDTATGDKHTVPR